MTTAAVPSSVRVLPLQNGDRLTRDEFERRYDATPGLKHAELINGIVYMPPPVSLEHGSPHIDLSTFLGVYKAATPGVDAADNSTTRLDLDNDPQPDGSLFVLPSHGGRAKISVDRYLEGAPELIAEVAASSASYDLHDKLEVYQRHGVQEYIIWRVLDSELDYFRLRRGRYQRLPLTLGAHRSEVFPGLWLDAAALLRHDLAGVLATLQQGLTTEEHRQFVKRLASRAAV